MSKFTLIFLITALLISACSPESLLTSEVRHKNTLAHMRNLPVVVVDRNIGMIEEVNVHDGITFFTVKLYNGVYRVVMPCSGSQLKTGDQFRLRLITYRFRSNGPVKRSYCANVLK